MGVHRDSQAEETGVTAGWKITECSYTKPDGSVASTQVSGANCLTVLKDTKAGAGKGAKFKVTGKAPQGRRHELLSGMKRAAMQGLRIDEDCQTISVEQYSELPRIFAQGAYRTVFTARPIEIELAKPSSGSGCIMKSVAPKHRETVQAGSRLLDINNQKVFLSSFSIAKEVFDNTKVPLSIT